MLRRVNSVRGLNFATEGAKRYGKGSEMPCFSRERRQENGTETEKLRRWQNIMDSSAVLFLVRKGPLGTNGRKMENLPQNGSKMAVFPFFGHFPPFSPVGPQREFLAIFPISGLWPEMGSVQGNQDNYKIRSQGVTSIMQQFKLLLDCDKGQKFAIPWCCLHWNAIIFSSGSVNGQAVL